MLSIGQFSKVCQVSVKTLRHYDKIELMKPCYIDELTGYRYYNNAQISTMLLIQRLKRYGFSLTDIKDLLSNDNKRVLFSKLKKQKNALQNQLKQTSLVLNEMERHLFNFERTGDIMGYQNNYEIKLKQSEELAILSSRQQMSVADFGQYYGKLYEKIAKEHLTVAGKTLAIYYDEEFNQECSDIEVAVEIKEREKANRILKSELCATTIHVGGYSSLSDAYGAVMKWIQENEYEVVDCPYEIYLKTQFDNLPVDQWETEIYFPVKQK